MDIRMGFDHTTYALLIKFMYSMNINGSK